MSRSTPAYDTVIFDLDGTLFRGRLPIPGASDAVEALRRSVRCRFLSNNGERVSSSLADRFRISRTGRRLRV